MIVHEIKKQSSLEGRRIHLTLTRTIMAAPIKEKELNETLKTGHASHPNGF